MRDEGDYYDFGRVVKKGGFMCILLVLCCECLCQNSSSKLFYYLSPHKTSCYM